MARLLRLDSRDPLHTVAGLMSAALHVGLLILSAFSGGRQDGVADHDTPTLQVVDRWDLMTQLLADEVASGSPSRCSDLSGRSVTKAPGSTISRPKRACEPGAGICIARSAQIESSHRQPRGDEYASS